MSIRPVDMQLTIPKTAEYSQQNQGEINKHNMAQMTLAHTSTKEAEHQMSMVIETNEQQTVNKDGQNRQEQQRKRRKKTEEKEPEKESNSTKTGLFDVRI